MDIILTYSSRAEAIESCVPVEDSSIDSTASDVHAPQRILIARGARWGNAERMFVTVSLSVANHFFITVQEQWR